MKLTHRRAHGIVWPILWIALVFALAATLLLMPPQLALAGDNPPTAAATTEDQRP